MATKPPSPAPPDLGSRHWRIAKELLKKASPDPPAEIAAYSFLSVACLATSPIPSRSHWQTLVDLCVDGAILGSAGTVAGARCSWWTSRPSPSRSQPRRRCMDSPTRTIGCPLPRHHRPAQPHCRRRRLHRRLDFEADLTAAREALRCCGVASRPRLTPNNAAGTLALTCVTCGLHSAKPVIVRDYAAGAAPWAPVGTG
jgi:hypothetical protein